MKTLLDSSISCIKQNKYNIEKFHFIKRLIKEKDYWILSIPGILFFIVFRYIPILGNAIAFKNFNIYRGLIDSPWVGLKYFKEFLSNPDFYNVMRNTLLLGVFEIMWTFPLPILFALFLNEIKNARYRKVIQTVSYMPHFLSIVVICSMLTMFLSPTNGMINVLMKNAFGIDPIYFLGRSEWFRTIYVSSSIWQNFGFDSIIYIAALAGVDSALYEAADIDGCGRMKKMWYISIPSILPTMVVLFVLKIGGIMGIGFEKVLLLYSPMTYDVADIISTFVYRAGLVDSRFSYATAVGLFNSVISLLFIVSANYLSRKFAENSLW